MREAVPAICLEEGRVGHRHERCLGHELARARQALEAGARPHPLPERTLRRTPDHRSVGERIGQRKAELDQVGAADDGRCGELGGLPLPGPLELTAKAQGGTVTAAATSARALLIGFAIDLGATPDAGGDDRYVGLTDAPKWSRS